MYTSLPRTQARSSGFKSNWDFGSALDIMRKANRKTRLADYDFKMAESNLCKTREKEKESFRVLFSEGKVHQLFLKDKIPCPHSSCEKDPQFFERNGISQHFRVVHKCTFMDVNLQESLALRRRLMPKKLLIFLMNVLKLEAKGETNSCACVILFFLKIAQREWFTPQI